MSVSTVVLIGIFALKTNQGIFSALGTGERHFKAVATAATEVASYAKRAEGHLFLYLALHRESDKKKFPERVQSLQSQISILDKSIIVPEAMKILEKIKTNTRDILTVGNALIAVHDKRMAESRHFDMGLHRTAILGIHENFSAVRRRGVELAAMEIQLEADLKSGIFGRASRLRVYTLLVILLASGVTLYLGHVLSRMIKTLQKEIGYRKQVEKTLQTEQDRLKAALSEVKVLGGLIPICASCKKIRDDMGYWNQIEAYLKEHSDLDFTHGICPECFETLYPELDEEKNWP